MLARHYIVIEVLDGIVCVRRLDIVHILSSSRGSNLGVTNLTDDILGACDDLTCSKKNCRITGARLSCIDDLITIRVGLELDFVKKRLLVF